MVVKDGLLKFLVRWYALVFDILHHVKGQPEQRNRVS